MAKLEEKAHAKLVTALADFRCSPAVMSRMMLDEYKYVNESFMQYFINYIIQMSTATHIPFHLLDVQEQCKLLYLSLQELGLTGTIGREPVSNTEYLSV